MIFSQFGTDGQSFQRFVRFGLVGVSSLVIYALLLATLIDILGVPVFLAAIISYGLSMGWNYALQRRWTFGSKTAHVASLPRYLVVHMVGMSLNAGLLDLGIWLTGWHYGTVQALAIVIVAVMNYVALKIWVFS